MGMRALPETALRDTCQMTKFFVTISFVQTDGLAAKLRALGYKVSQELLWLDIHKGWLSPSMPEHSRSGKGRTAQWSPPAVRRAVYMARLRKRGVNGRVLPLLLWMRDGWGWSA